MFIMALSGQKRTDEIKKITFNQFGIAILISIGLMILAIGLMSIME